MPAPFLLARLPSAPSFFPLSCFIVLLPVLDVYTQVPVLALGDVSSSCVPLLLLLWDSDREASAASSWGKRGAFPMLSSRSCSSPYVRPENRFWWSCRSPNYVDRLVGDRRLSFRLIGAD